MLHGYFAASIPDSSLALAQVGGLQRGQCRLAGLIDSAGHECIANTDPLGQRASAPPLYDDLTRDLFGGTGARLLRLSTLQIATPFAQLLGAPAVVFGVPIANAGAIVHWLVFGGNAARQFDALAPDSLLIEANLAANLIIRPLVTRALRDETARQRQAIEGLADVQRLLLPDHPRIAGLDYAVHWQPAETAAGDYYDLADVTRHAPADFARDRYAVWVVTLADVSGHGAAAAMEAVQFDAILRTYQGDAESGPAGALTYANRFFFSRRQRQHFLTAIALLYRPDLRRAIFVDAGHPPLLHRHGGGVTARGGGSQIPLGVLRDHVWHNDEFDADIGDLLVLYTDGVIDARDAAERPFGGERLLELVREGPDEPAALLALLRRELITHQGAAIGADDQTLIVLHITG